MTGAEHRETATIRAFELLYEQRYRQFVRVAEAIVGETELARDAVQEAFASAIRHRFDFRGEGSLEGWVWRTVVNTARSVKRALPPAHLPLEDAADAQTANGSGPRHDVRVLVAALPERQRLVLFLRYYADLDYRQIADALEIQPGTVGAALNAAHAAIRRLLEEVPR